MCLGRAIPGPFGTAPRVEPAEAQKIPFSSELQTIVLVAQNKAGDERVTTAHLLAAVGLQAPADLLSTLRAMSLNEVELLQGLAALGKPQVTNASAPVATGASLEQDMARLAEFGDDLTALASCGKLEPAYGRDAVLKVVMRCLLRRTKRNVVLAGGAGVGKTRIVQGLAWRIVNGEVPESLQGDRIFQLDLVRLRSGAKYGGEIESRVQTVLEVLQRQGERLILFIDELHTIVGSPVGGQALDLGNAFKPLLAGGAIRVIGATTLEEYAEYIEPDAALERRFTLVPVPEPTAAETLTILQAVSPRFAQHFGVQYAAESLSAIVSLADKHLVNRRFPDKAIDLLDDVGAWVKMAANPVSEVLPAHVVAVLADRLGIAEDDLMGKEKVSAAELAERMKARVVGQDNALQTIADHVVAAMVETRPRPRAVLLLLGPSGTGKTMSGLVLAETLFGDASACLQLNMSEFPDSPHAAEFAVNRLLGPHRPYVGWEHGGLLTNFVQEHPRSVILLDEFEKTGREVQNLFLQIFDQGWCLDGRGRRTSFVNTIFLLTSNAAAELWEQQEEHAPLGFLGNKTPHADTHVADGPPEADVMEALHKGGWETSLLGRLDRIVSFVTLSEEDLKTLGERRLQEEARRLETQWGKKLVWDPGMPAYLVSQLVEKNGRSLHHLYEKVVSSTLRRLWLDHPADWAQTAEVTLRLSSAGPALEPQPLRGRMLIVDDQSDAFEGMQAAYPEYDWQHVRTLPDALAAVGRQQPHLVLIDVCLDETNAEDHQGIEVLRAIKAAFPQQVVVLLTARETGWATTADAFRQGAYDYWWRPPSASVLRTLVEATLARQRAEEEQQRMAKLLRSRQGHNGASPAPVVRGGQIDLLYCG